MSSGSSRRAVQALETRGLIVDAARRLFTEKGYGATSIGEIAKEAGVAVPTVYASAGTKPTLLRLLLDRIDEEAGIGELAGQLFTSTEPKQILGLEVQITRQLAERCGDIIAALQSAAGVEPELAATFAAGMARHRAGAEATVQRLLGLGALRADLAPDAAAAILATLTAPSVYASLTGEYGWSFDECQAWLGQTLAKQLLSRTRTGAPSGG
jgi:AcrR family transcriptional regulator